MVCTFFGHRKCPPEARGTLIEILIELIENERVRVFYVGNQGEFDSMAYSVLDQLKHKYSYIEIYVVLAYLPNKKLEETVCSLYPEGIECVPKRFAISYRNNWMIERADIVIVYVAHNWGGAAKFMQLGKRKNKRIINIV